MKQFRVWKSSFALESDAVSSDGIGKRKDITFGGKRGLIQRKFRGKLKGPCSRFKDTRDISRTYYVKWALWTVGCVEASRRDVANTTESVGRSVFDGVAAAEVRYWETKSNGLNEPKRRADEVSLTRDSLGSEISRASSVSFYSTFMTEISR